MEKEFRWSYDPRTKELDVWDAEGGRASHYDRCGDDGYRFCAQGRIYPDAYNTIYKERPFQIDGKFSDENHRLLTKLHEEAKLAVEAWMKDNNLPYTVWYTN